MKLTALIFLSACLAATGRTTAQTITLSLRKVGIEKAFAKVHKQSGVEILYTKSMIKDSPKVTVELRNADMETAMNEILKNQRLSFSIVNNTIVIKENVQDEKSLNSNDKAIPQQPPALVSGTVTDSAGAPLSGASMVLKHNGKIKSYTLTDQNGE